MRRIVRLPAVFSRAASRSSNLKSVEAYAGYPLHDAVKLSKAYAMKQFDETVELQVVTGVDPRKPNQMVRGVAELPHGTGNAVRVAVFAKDAKADEAREAGADIVGQQDLADQITEGKINFDRVVATPDMMAVVGKVARVLGPRGLMPNPKLGTVTMDVATAVTNAKKGQLQFKCERGGTVMVPVGKVSFSITNLEENISSFMDQLVEAKPSGAKGQFLHRAYLSSTMGPSVKLDLTKSPFNLVQQL